MCVCVYLCFVCVCVSVCVVCLCLLCECVLVFPYVTHAQNAGDSVFNSFWSRECN